MQFISREELPEWVASERYQAGLFDPEGAHLNPLKLALGLAAAKQGYSGHGVLPTLAGARAVSDAILGQPDELALYQGLINGSFPGGKYFAAPLEAIGKAWYRLRDSI